MKWKFVLTLLCVVAIACVGLALAFDAFKQVGNVGSVKKVGVEVYDLSMNPVNQIDWGTLEQGETKTLNFKVQSLSNVPAILDMNHDLAISIGSLSWNLQDATIQPSEILDFTLTLTISPQTEVESFNFLIWIYITA